MSKPSHLMPQAMRVFFISLGNDVIAGDRIDLDALDSWLQRLSGQFDGGDNSVKSFLHLWRSLCLTLLQDIKCPLDV